MKIPYRSLLFLTLLLPATAADLDVVVTGLTSTQGKVNVAVYTSKDTFLKTPAQGLAVAIEPNATSVRVHFTNLPDEKFAVSAYHDLNDNGKLDSNYMGIPKEPVGFANKAKGRFGPPAYADACIDPLKQKEPLTIKLGSAR